MSHAEHRLSVGINDDLGSGVEHVVRSEPATRTEGEGDPLLGSVRSLEKCRHFVLTEPHFRVVALLVLLEIHVSVMPACRTKIASNLVFSVVCKGAIGPILSETTAVLGQTVLIETYA